MAPGAFKFILVQTDVWRDINNGAVRSSDWMSLLQLVLQKSYPLAVILKNERQKYYRGG
jgi:hypothetical protein